MIDSRAKCDDGMVLEMRVFGPEEVSCSEKASCSEMVKIRLKVYPDQRFTVSVAVSETALLAHVATPKEKSFPEVLAFESMQPREQTLHGALLSFPLSWKERVQIVSEMIDFLDEHLGAALSEKPGRVTNTFLSHRC